jgi:hypothetical protein
MDSNLTLILKEFEELKGQFVINHNVVERFIAIGTDDQDYYYVTYNGRETKWNTCVGRIIPLKGKIDEKHYKEFIRLAKLNHYDQAGTWGRDDEWATNHKLEITELGENNDKYLTDICWDLN